MKSAPMHQARPQRQARRVPLPSLLPALACLLTAALITSPARAAGEVELRFVQPEQFTDIGLGHFDREQNLRVLREHVQRLGETLPDGQRLEIEVTDVDLAGRIEPHRPDQLRVLRGSADWPQITLRYTLKAGDTTLAQGDEHLSDPSYLFPRRRATEHQSLPYERRLLDVWFKERITPAMAAAR